MIAPALSVRSIGADEIDASAQFLHDTLNPRVSAAAWRSLFHPPWQAHAPNSGFVLLDAAGQPVGAYAAVYSTRVIDDEPCCLQSRGVLCAAGVSAHSIAARPIASGATRVRLHGLLPERERRRHERAPRLPAPRHVRAPGGESPRADSVRCPHHRDPDVLTAPLRGRDSDVFRDHLGAAAARHVLVETDAAYAYLVYRKDRRKRLPWFAMPLYAGGDRDLLRRPPGRASVRIS